VKSFLAGLDKAPGRRAQSVGGDAFMFGRVVRCVVRNLPVTGRVARVTAAADNTQHLLPPTGRS